MTPASFQALLTSLSTLMINDLFRRWQVRLTTGARLHPLLASYWARAVVKMILIPSQVNSHVAGLLIRATMALVC